MKILLIFALIVSVRGYTQFPMGGNLGAISFDSHETVFVDQIKASKQFGQFAYPNITTGMTYDSDGWPLQDFGVVLFHHQDVPEEVPETVGTWYLDWIGNANVATIYYQGTVLNQTYDSGTNKGSAYVQVASNQYSLWLQFSTSNKGVKNLRAIRPGYSITNPPTFAQSYLNQISGLNTFRYMDWTLTNGSPVKSWSDRATMTTAQYSVKGVPWEVCIQLSNLLLTNMYISVPHMADNDYVYNLASLLNSTLYANLTVYVEYSNEVWNKVWPQYNYCLQDAIAMSKNATWAPIIAWDNTTNGPKLLWRRTALVTMAISNIFKQVYGKCGTQAKIVLGTQIEIPLVVLNGLTVITKFYGNPSNYFYATGGAPYFNLGNSNNLNNLTTSDVLSILTTASSQVDIVMDYSRQAAAAIFYKLQLISYGGGPDTSGNNSISAKMNATLSPGFSTVVNNFVKDWYAKGGSLLTWSNWAATVYNTAAGTWGVTNNQFNQNTTKLAALRSIMASPLPKITQGDNPPFTVDGANSIYSTNTVGPWMNITFDSYSWYWMRETHSIGATYSLTLNYTSYTSSFISVSVNSNFLTPSMVLPEGNVFSTPLNFTIYNGLNVLELRSTTQQSNTFQINQVIIKLIQQETVGPTPQQCTETTTSTSGVATAGPTSTTGSTGTTGDSTTTGAATSTTGQVTTTTAGTTASDITNVSSASQFQITIVLSILAAILLL